MKDRIAALISNKNLSSSKFADKVGVQRSSISHILSGRNNPSLDFIQKILICFPNVNSDWLITGHGDMYNNNTLTEEDQDLFLNTIEIEDEKPSPTPPRAKKQKNEDIDTQMNGAFGLSQDDSDRQIERVVVFFTDKTFREYKPS